MYLRISTELELVKSLWDDRRAVGQSDTGGLRRREICFNLLCKVSRKNGVQSMYDDIRSKGGINIWYIWYSVQRLMIYRG